jgi:hypothetical protein
MCLGQGNLRTMLLRFLVILYKWYLGRMVVQFLNDNITIVLKPSPFDFSYNTLIYIIESYKELVSVLSLWNYRTNNNFYAVLIFELYLKSFVKA